MAAVRSRAQYRVAVVGAGIAGLTTANALVTSHKLRVDELCVLEAQSRIGGRVQTRAFSDTLPVNIEVGAAWIHGTVGNPFAELAEKFGLPLKEISARNPWLHPESCKNFLLVDRDAQLSEERVQATWQMYELLLQKLQQFATASDASHDGKSLAQLVDMLAEQDVNLHAAVESCTNGRARLDFCVRLIEIWMGATAEALQLDDFVEIDLIGDDPGPHCIVPDGMERFVDHLAEPIAECIQTNVCVKSITHQDNGTDGSRGVVIECSDGRTIKADYVIVTSALGLLKAGELSFTPALPQEKHEAIQRSQMGQYMKVLVQFPQVFWQRDASFIGQLDQTLASTVSGNRLFFPLMFNYYAAKKVPVLEGVLIGATAVQVSSLSDKQIVDAFFKQLQETFGTGIPAPVNQFITRWDQDPWAHGAYSCLTVDSSEDDPETLRRPVGSSVLFAGEATIYKYQGALQAAAQASMASNDSLQQRIRRGEVPCRGANVGGWLVAEHWMTWDSVIWENVPSEISDKGEFATMTHLGHDQGDQRFEQHRATWIQESDIAEMKRFGLNTVRVPVGYWIMGYDPTDISNKQEWRVFAPNALKFLDQLVNDWCVKYDLAVLIDIHGAKGSQNGRDHSAPPTCSVKYWSDYPENVENTVQFACFLAARYRDSPALLGIGLLNEPECPVDRQVLENYYKRTYAAIRRSGNDCVLTVAPFLTEQGPPFMEDFMRFPDYFNVWHEWHPYFIWGYEGQSKKQILQAVQQYGNQVGSWRGNWLLISEWSLGSPASAFPAEDRESLKQFASAQLQALGNAHSGWTFWSWKHSDDMHNKPSGWSLRQLLRDGVIKI